MDLQPYLETIRQQLLVTAEAGGEEARELTERLVATLGSATRLALLNALSDAADLITRDLAPGSVEVRLRGTDPTFVVTQPPAEQHVPDDATVAPTAPVVTPTDDGGGTSRINVRLPDQLKQRVEAAAARDGLSVNAWLVRVAAAALEPRQSVASRTTRGAEGGQSFSGWVR